MNQVLRPILLRTRDSLRRKYLQLEHRPDSEHEQAMLRMIIGLMLLAYVLSPLYSADYGAALDHVQWAMGLFAGFSVAVYLWVLFSQGVKPARRLLGMAGDLGTTSFILAIGGEGATVFIAVYLWVTIGNGFRYGMPYLYASAGLSCLGFSLVLAFGDFWATYRQFGISVMLLLVVIPIYMGSLLKKLRAAMQRANEANQAKSQFLANMSHELRTPLNGVIGLSDLLMETPIDKNQQDLAESIQTSAHSLLHIVNDILDLSKIEAGKVEHEEVEWDLHQLVGEIKRMFHHPARRKGLTLITRIDPEIPFRLRGDVQHLKQVLVNLIGNAIKFTDEGHVELRIRRDPATDETDPLLNLVFEIEDTGIGIPLDRQKAVFETFSQADASMNRRYGGTGLGTSIAKQLVELLHGSIGLHSEPGVGSTFWVSIPFEPITDSAEDKEPGNQLTGIRVLLLTSTQLSHSLQGALDLWGVDWESVRNEQDAIAALLNPHGPDFDGLLVERELVNDQALSLATTLSEDTRLHKLHLILLNDLDTGDDEQMLQAGYATVLHLPLNRTWLFNALHQASSEFEAGGNVVSLADHYERRGGAQQLRILVADDNLTNRRVIAGILEQAGHEVLTTDGGEQALDLLLDPANAISLAFLDMNMPDMGGLDVVKAYRFSVGSGQRIPVGILTADATEQARLLGNQAGASFFLTKPVNARRLLDTVAEHAPEPDIPMTQPVSPLLPAGKTAEPPTANSLIVEAGTLDELAQFGGGLKFLNQLIIGFDTDSRQLVQKLRNAVQDRDYPQMQSYAHALKGTAAQLGAVRIEDLCANLERTRPPEMASSRPIQLVDELDRLFDRTVSALRDYIGRESQQR